MPGRKSKGVNRAGAAMLVMAALFAGGCERAPTGATMPVDDLFRLAHMNGCVQCHTDSATVIGPSWRAIAERYRDMPRADARLLLVESVRKGSQGKWPTWKGADGMPPLEKRVSADHIEQLVDYILGLNP